MLKGRINFNPRPHQKAVLTDKHRHRGVAMHRRAGKTVCACVDGWANLLACPLPSPRGVYIAPYRIQAKKLAWDYLRRMVRGNANGQFVINESELTITFTPNDAKFVLAGGDNVDALRGHYFDWVCIDEVADCDPRLWPEVIRPALADRKGRALILGTPKGRMNLLYDLSRKPADDPEWSWHCYDVTQTDALDPMEVEAARREMSEPLFQQEFMCSFNAALVGAVFGTEMNELQNAGRFTSVKYEKSLPVWCAWDLGFADATSVWFIQVAGTEIRAIDYREWTLTSLVDIINDIKGMGYRNMQHIVPHDIMVRELGSGRSRADILEQMGINFDIAPNWSVEDGIEAVRMICPHLWIDYQQERALECLVNYRFDYDEKRRAFKVAPLHDWTSHCVDALRMFAVTHSANRQLSMPLEGGALTGLVRRRNRQDGFT
jgi:hypothetical protein